MNNIISLDNLEIILEVGLKRLENRLNRFLQVGHDELINIDDIITASQETVGGERSVLIQIHSTQQPARYPDPDGKLWNALLRCTQRLDES